MPTPDISQYLVAKHKHKIEVKQSPLHEREFGYPHELVVHTNPQQSTVVSLTDQDLLNLARVVNGRVSALMEQGLLTMRRTKKLRRT
jgi:hypothetical protein